VRVRLKKDYKFVKIRVLYSCFLNTPDILWVDKVQFFSRQYYSLLHKLFPAIKIVYFSPDDMFNQSSERKKFKESISLVDWVVSTKTFNKEDYQRLGCNKVIIMGNGFDPVFHVPIDDVEKLYDISFIGGFEAARYSFMETLGKHGYVVHYFCPKFPRNLVKSDYILHHEGFQGGGNYSKIISSTKINLCFLRKENRDVQTTRSVEIPACRGFMLGERTDEHKGLFREGLEAEYFDNVDECMKKIKYYLSDDEKRNTIAENGFLRCQNSGYSNDERLKFVMRKILHENFDI
jgi:spore maturation protein CgeB